MLSFALNYRIGGLTVGGYHLVNLFVHITNGLLVYTLVSLLYQTPILRSGPSPLSRSQARTAALVTALLFITHPIQTQAVTYIVQRFTSLSATFYLTAMVCYLKWRLSTGPSRNRSLWYAGALAAAMFAMQTKESSFTLPLLLLISERLCFPAGPRRWVSFVPFLATLLIIPLSLPWVMVRPDNPWFVRESTEISRLSYLLTQFRVIVTYLRLLVLPAHQNLDYDFPLSTSLLDPPALASLLLLLALAGTALYLIVRRTPYWMVGFGLLWFFVTLSVESSIIPIRDVIFEHRVYLPSVGIFLALVSLAAAFRSHLHPVPVLVVVSTVLTIYSVATYARNRVWRDDITLWSHVVAESPRKSKRLFGRSRPPSGLIQRRLPLAWSWGRFM